MISDTLNIAIDTVKTVTIYLKNTSIDNSIKPLDIINILLIVVNVFIAIMMLIVTKRNLIVSQRPYINILYTSNFKYVDTMNYFSLKITLENNGDIPAKNVSFNAETTFVGINKISESLLSTSTIFPKRTLTATEIILKDKDFEEFKSGGLLEISSNIKYDGFATKKHITYELCQYHIKRNDI